MAYRVLFVCMGNICRSPAAECIFRKRVEEAGLSGKIDCDSAGTIGYHQGNPPDARMRAELTGRGIAVAGQARQVRNQDLQDFDLILAMDRDNLADLQALPAAEQVAGRIRLFCEFCQTRDTREVPDPYYGGDAGFSFVADLIEDGVAGLIAYISSELESCGGSGVEK